MDLSNIQVKILTKFITSEGLRYSEAKPQSVDNDLYKYHLKFLVTKGYLQKIGDIYNLTPEGKLFGYKITSRGELQTEFRVCVMCILITDSNKILLQKKFKHPAYGETTVVSGKVKKGEKIVDCASRKFLEEAGLTAKFKHIGQLRAIRYNKTGKLVNDQWFNVCLANEYTGELIEDNKYWQNYFISLNEFFDLQESGVALKNLKEIVQQIQDKKYPFLIEDEAVIEL